MELKKLVKNLTKQCFRVLVDEDVIAIYDSEGYFIYSLNTKGNNLSGLEKKEDIVSYFELARNYSLQSGNTKNEHEFVLDLENIGLIVTKQSLWITVYTKTGKLLNNFNRRTSGMDDIDNSYKINGLFTNLSQYIQTPDEERGLEERYWLQVHVPQTSTEISRRYLVQKEYLPDIWDILTLDEIVTSKSTYNTCFTAKELETIDETGTVRKTSVII